GYPVAGNRNRRKRNRTGTNKITAGIWTLGTRVPGYPLIVLYGARKTGIYVDLYIHCCAPRLSFFLFSLLSYYSLRTTRDTQTIPLPATRTHTRYPYQLPDAHTIPLPAARTHT
ncbi:unnamed protein product, partial [Laminaria digitata]